MIIKIFISDPIFVFMAISYSMCWEDPLILLEGLNLSDKDDVLSIVSGGENVLAILLQKPNSLTGIDFKKEQIYLTKLKITAIKNLDFEEFVRFIGFTNSTTRVKVFNKLKIHLEQEVSNYWNNNLESIKIGIIHCGKFEKYLNKFRTYCFPLIISKSRISQFLLLDTLKEQSFFYNKYWNNWRFRFLFKLFFSRKGLESGRDKQYFEYSSQNNISYHYLDRVKHGLIDIPIKTNFFMHYILTGKIPIPFKNHPYLDKENFYRLKKILKKNDILFVNSDIFNYLKKIKKDSFSKYNLSDVFEAKTQKEYEEILKNIERISKSDSRLAYWNNLVIRNNHDIKSIEKDKKLSEELYDKDKVHFYSNFTVEKIN